MRTWVCALIVVVSLGCSGGGSQNDGGGGQAGGIAGQAGSVAGQGGGAAGQAGGAAGQAGGAAGQAGGAGGQAGTVSSGGRGGAAGAGGTSAGGAGGQAGATGGRGGAAGGSAGRGGAAGGIAGAGGQAGSAPTGGRGGGSDGGVNFCARLSGATFMSLDMLECGRGPDGGALCRWRINFTDATMFTWLHSDFGEAGTYTCAGNTITAQRQTGGPITATYDPATQRLTWDGVLYACASCTSF